MLSALWRAITFAAWLLRADAWRSFRSGAPVTIRVRVGHWRCRNERCDRHIFAERLPGLAGPSARQADRLAEIVRLFGHSAGGRPSERLMVRLGMHVSDSTILRRVKHHARIGPEHEPASRDFSCR